MTEINNVNKQENMISNISSVIDAKDKILAIFSNKEDVEKVKQIIDIDLGKISMGMSDFQINSFVLNKREFTNDLFQYKQAKMELFTRMNGFVDSYYQLKEAQAKIKLAEGEIEDLQNNSQNLNHKVKEAKIDLQEIEIEKNKFRLSSIEKQAKEKLREALVFYNAYDKYKYLENKSSEELAKLEEEGWRIKSAYYQELVERYQLTPKGFIPLPHLVGGLNKLIELQDREEKKILGQLGRQNEQLSEQFSSDNKK